MLYGGIAYRCGRPFPILAVIFPVGLNHIVDSKPEIWILLQMFARAGQLCACCTAEKSRMGMVMYQHLCSICLPIQRVLPIHHLDFLLERRQERRNFFETAASHDPLGEPYVAVCTSLCLVTAQAIRSTKDTFTYVAFEIMPFPGGVASIAGPRDLLEGSGERFVLDLDRPETR